MSGESAFIESLRALAAHPAARNLLDDTTIFEIGAETIILTHDTMAEGVHFLPDQDPADIAWKLVARNLSDLAAKGAEPLGVLLSYTLTQDNDRFVEGLSQALTTFDIPLLGGDTISFPAGRVFGMTAIGRASFTPVPARSGARASDLLYVTGEIGAAMLGFEALRDGKDTDSIAYRRPVPLLDEGRKLVPHVSAIMDISDGLLIDTKRIAEASEVTIDVDTRSIPIAPPEARREDALRWGDDYQLLFTASPSAQLPVTATRIGKVIDAENSPLLLDGEIPIKGVSLGYQH